VNKWTYFTTVALDHAACQSVVHLILVTVKKLITRSLSIFVNVN